MNKDIPATGWRMAASTPQSAAGGEEYCVQPQLKLITEIKVYNP